MIKSLTHEQAKAIALKHNMPICLCGCRSPTRQVMEFYRDIADAIIALNGTEKNDKTMTDIVERQDAEIKRLRGALRKIAHMESETHMGWIAKCALEAK